jgi:hypothetical protein
VLERGLHGIGCDIKTLGEVDVLEDEICNFIGQKFDKNGWKFKLHIDSEVQKVIVDLYICVYEKKGFE